MYVSFDAQTDNISHDLATNNEKNMKADLVFTFIGAFIAGSLVTQMYISIKAYVKRINGRATDTK